MKFVRLMAATAGSLLVLAPTAAYAGSDLHVDATGDSVTTISPSSQEYLPASTHLRGDISYVRVTHAGSTVKVELGFNALQRYGAGAYFGLALHTSNGLDRIAAVQTKRANWNGVHGLSTLRGRPVACRGLTHRIAYGARTVTVTIPRSCIGNPAWIRVGTYAVVKENGHYFQDDGYTGGFSQNYVYGPRVHH